MQLSQLPLHIHLQFQWLSISSFAEGSPRWNPAWHSSKPTNGNTPPQAPRPLHEHLQTHLQHELQQRLQLVMQGIQALSDTPFEQPPRPDTLIWQDGASRVIDYGEGAGDSILLAVPSLINRYYIMDLLPKRSFLRSVLPHTARCMVVDWGYPGEEEAHFSTQDYIQRLQTIIQTLSERYDKPVVLAGYCMGGVLAVAASQLMQSYVQGLILLATPWDYHVEDMRRVTLCDSQLQGHLNAFLSGEIVPKDVIQAIFYYLHPEMVERKFIQAAQCKSLANDPIAAVEYWVNDGVAMPRRVWQECCHDWMHHNSLHEGKWHVGETPIEPENITLPSLLITGAKDSIVPPASSYALYQKLANATWVEPETGHIGLMTAANACQTTYSPVINWLKALSKSEA